MSEERSKSEEQYLQSIGKKIRALRENAGYSQESFARLCQLDRTYVSDIERGQRNLSLLNLRKIAKALKVVPKELL